MFNLLVLTTKMAAVGGNKRELISLQHVTTLLASCTSQRDKKYLISRFQVDNAP